MNRKQDKEEIRFYCFWFNTQVNDAIEVNNLWKQKIKLFEAGFDHLQKLVVFWSKIIADKKICLMKQAADTRHQHQSPPYISFLLPFSLIYSQNC